MTSAAAGARKRAKKPVGHWPLVAALIVELVWSLFEVGAHVSDFAGPSLANNLGYAMGASMVMVLIVWSVTYFGFVVRSAWERGPAYALILFAFAVAVELGAAALLSRNAQEKAQARTAAQEIETSFSALAHPKSGAPALDTRARATGWAGELEHLTKVYMGQLQQDQRDYKAEIAASGLGEALRPRHIAVDPSLRRTRADVAKAAAVAEKFRLREHARLAEFRRSVEQSALKPELKRGVLDGFDRAAAEHDPDAVWKLEADAVSEIDAALVVLQHAEGRWFVRGDKILFMRPADMQAYNGHLVALKDLVRQEADLRSAAIQRTTQAFEEMRRRAE